ncbi:hypothetical protein L9F63_009806, partial [Diploptera punctata]
QILQIQLFTLPNIQKQSPLGMKNTEKLYTLLFAPIKYNTPTATIQPSYKTTIHYTNRGHIKINFCAG